MKLAVIVGTRPEILRLSLVIKKSKNIFDLVLIHTGQNWDYNLNDIFFDELDIPKPKYFLDCNKGSLGENMGGIIHKTYDVLSKEKPNALLILGDTNSCLSAISAKRLKIPIFHMEAGNRCFDFRVPEEINRRIVDHVSDINLCYTENSRNYLINEGFTKDNVFVTGSPMPEIMEYYKDNIDNSQILYKLSNTYNIDLKPNSYFLVSIHREENLDLDNNLMSIINSIKSLVDTHNIPVIFSTHPRTKNKLNELNIDLSKLNNVFFCQPFGYFDYVNLIKNSKCFISDSGTVSEEAAHLKVPAITVRNSIERPEAVENGNIIVSGLSSENILSSINFAIQSMEDSYSVPHDYTIMDVSNRAIKIIMSYYHIVDKKTWFKNN